MVRSWSCVNTLNFNLSSFKKVTKVSTLILFKSAVYLKRFNFKISKFKRKLFARWKHSANWLPYLNVIKYWVTDYKYNRQLTRYQYRNQISINSFIIYDFNYSKSKLSKEMSLYSDLLTVCISKRKYVYFILKKYKNLSIFPRNANFLKAFVIGPDLNTLNPHIITIARSNEDVSYTPCYSDLSYTNLIEILTFPFSIHLNKITELYKILFFHFTIILICSK